MVMHELLTAGEDVLVFYNDKASFNSFLEVQRKVRAISDTSAVSQSAPLVARPAASALHHKQLSLEASSVDPDESSCQLRYHVELVKLLACCTMGKNVITEIKCHSLLPLDDIVKMVCHPDTLPEVKDAYVNFLTHCYIDTEAEVKEIYASNHMWQLFECSFIHDMEAVTLPRSGH